MAQFLAALGPLLGAGIRQIPTVSINILRQGVRILADPVKGYAFAVASYYVIEAVDGFIVNKLGEVRDWADAVAQQLDETSANTPWPTWPSPPQWEWVLQCTDPLCHIANAFLSFFNYIFKLVMFLGSLAAAALLTVLTAVYKAVTWLAAQFLRYVAVPILSFIYDGAKALTQAALDFLCLYTFYAPLVFAPSVIIKEGLTSRSLAKAAGGALAAWAIRSVLMGRCVGLKYVPPPQTEFTVADTESVVLTVAGPRPLEYAVEDMEDVGLEVTALPSVAAYIEDLEDVQLFVGSTQLVFEVSDIEDVQVNTYVPQTLTFDVSDNEDVTLNVVPVQGTIPFEVSDNDDVQFTMPAVQTLTFDVSDDEDVQSSVLVVLTLTYEVSDDEDVKFTSGIFLTFIYNYDLKVFIGNALNINVLYDTIVSLTVRSPPSVSITYPVQVRLLSSWSRVNVTYPVEIKLYVYRAPGAMVTYPVYITLKVVRGSA